ncbi:unnamed protein product [Rhizophagus irregularis]|nr:unnamed protein product [Rhizophagus irregularis]
MVINLGIKRRSKKLLDRINESRTTQLFILTSLLQAILIFQMWLCFNAIYNQNTIQIITIAAANFFCASFGIIQMLEVRKCWKLYRQFGWNIYKKIGGDIQKQAMFRTYLPKPFYLFHIAVSGLIFLNQIIGYRSVKKEMKLGSDKDSWYFFIIFLIVGIIMTLLSLIWSVFVYKNFGQGLQDHLDQKNKESSANNNNLLLVSNEKRWSIED